jgi:glutathione S-transferase
MEAIVREDIAALAAQLGEQDFMFGDRICTADCTVYGFLAVFRWSAFEWFAKDAVLSHTNLVDYVERIRARYWAT